MSRPPRCRNSNQRYGRKNPCARARGPDVSNQESRLTDQTAREFRSLGCCANPNGASVVLLNERSTTIAPSRMHPGGRNRVTSGAPISIHRHRDSEQHGTERTDRTRVRSEPDAGLVADRFLCQPVLSLRHHAQGGSTAPADQGRWCVGEPARCHCEERSYEAIPVSVDGDCFVRKQGNGVGSHIVGHVMAA